MSDQPVEELLIRISADVQGLVAGLQKTNGVVEALAGKIGEKIEHGVSHGFFKAELAVHAFEKALDFVKEQTLDLVKEQFSLIESTGRMANKLGITTEAMSALREAMRENGVDADEAARAMTRMQRALSEASDPASRTAYALKALQINLTELRAISPDQQFALIAGRLNAMHDASERAAVAMEFFGKNGVQVAQALPEGSRSLAEAAEETKKLGTALSAIDVAKVVEANKSFRHLHDTFEGIAAQMAITSAPFLEVLATQVTTLLTDTTDLHNKVKTVFQAIITGVAYASDAVLGFQIIWAGVKVAVLAVNDAAVQVSTAINKLIIEVSRFVLTLVTQMLNAIAQSVSSAMKTLADGVSYVSESSAKSIRDMADKISKTSTDLSKGIVDDINNVADQRVQADNDAAATATVIYTAAKNDLNALMSQPIPHDAIIQWGQEFFEEADKRAKQVAERATEAVSGGGGGPHAEEPKKKDGPTMQQFADLDDVRKKLQTETEIEMEEYARRYDLIAAMKAETDANDVEAQEQLNATLEQVQQQHELTMFQIRQKAIRSEDTIEKAKRAALVGGTAKMFGDLASLMNTHSRKAFEIGKAAAIAQATISGYQAAVAAFAAGMLTGGPYAPVIAAAYAAASLVSTGAQIASIASTSFGGGGGGGGGGGSTPSVPSVDGASQGANGAGSAARQVSITLIGKSYDRGQIEDLVAAINDAGDDGVKIRR